MKKQLLILLFSALCHAPLPAQQIFNEVKTIQQSFLTIKQDRAKPMSERKVASFQYDAIEYMLYKGHEDSTFSERQLGNQTIAMTTFVKLYLKRLSEAKNKQKKALVISRFRMASVNNSLFHDMDKDLAEAYLNNTKFVTPFSLDTDWEKALAEIRGYDW